MKTPHNVHFLNQSDNDKMFSFIELFLNSWKRGSNHLTTHRNITHLPEWHGNIQVNKKLYNFRSACITSCAFEFKVYK